MSEYPDSWIHPDAAAELLDVKVTSVYRTARNENWRRATDKKGRTVYATADVRTTHRNRQKETR